MGGRRCGILGGADGGIAWARMMWVLVGSEEMVEMGGLVEGWVLWVGGSEGVRG